MARLCRLRLRLLPLLLLAAAAVLTSAPGGALAKSKLAKKSDDIVNGPLLTDKLKAKRTLIVGPDEEFKTVQSAIDAVPAGNAEWIIVHLRSGVHKYAARFLLIRPVISLGYSRKGKLLIDVVSMCVVVHAVAKS